MNFSLPTTLGDWTLIIAAIVVTHVMFVVGGHLGMWHTADGHIQLGS
jgi:hypothetical protein